MSGKAMENQNNINTSTLWKQMKQLDTKYEFENTLACAISE